MKTPLSYTARASLAALVIWAAFGTALGQEYREAPAADTVILVPSLPEAEREGQVAARALAARRQQMIDDCEQNNGTDCEREVDTELRAEGLQLGARIIHFRPAR